MRQGVQSSKKSKLNLNTMKMMMGCAVNAKRALDFRARISFRKKSSGVEKFLSRIFPSEYLLYVSSKILILKRKTVKKTMFKACISFGKGSNLTKTVKLLAPKLCLVNMWQHRNVSPKLSLGDKVKEIKKGPLAAINAVRVKWALEKSGPPTLELHAGMRFQINTDKLTLKGMVKLNKKEAYLRARLEGIWKEPLGIKNVAIGQLGAGIGFPLLPTPTSPTLFTFAGMIGLGKASECKEVMLKAPKTAGVVAGTVGKGETIKVENKMADKFCIHGRVAVQTHATNKAKNYFAASVGPINFAMTIRWVRMMFASTKKESAAGSKTSTVSRAKGKAAKGKAAKAKAAANAHAMNRFFGILSFPKGFSMSIAAEPQVAAGGFRIPQGIAINGMVKVKHLGWGYLKLQVDVDNLIYICQVEISPVKLGGLQLVRNHRDTHLGPKMFFEFNFLTKRLAINMEGLITIWGVRSYVRMVANPDGFTWVSDAPILGVLQSRLSIKAVLPFGKKSGVNATKLSFDAQLLPGALMTTLYPNVKAVITTYVKNMIKKLVGKKNVADQQLKKPDREEVNRAHLYWEKYYRERLGEAVKADPLDQTLGENGIDTTMNPEEAAQLQMLGDTNSNNAAFGRRRKEKKEESKTDSATRRRRFSAFRKGVSYSQGAKKSKRI